jgi:hypothetical protein
MDTVVSTSEVNSNPQALIHAFNWAVITGVGSRVGLELAQELSSELSQE